MENSTRPKLSLADVQQEFHNFGIIDYIVFAAMLVGCSFIGVFYALRTKPKKGTDEASEYLMGGRQMALFPVSMSLVASFISGIALLGTPTEIYLHGIEYLFVVIPMVIAGYLGVTLFIPVFYDLQLSSTYEYLYLRFNNKVRILGSALFTLSLTTWLPIVIYVPALAFNQVTGVNVHIVTPVVCIVCIFYTCIGGLKAVVWTDVVQTFLMIAAIMTIIIKSTMDVGGLGEVISKSWESGRIGIPTLDPNPTIRHSFFSILVGCSFHQIQNMIINQNMVQRFLSLPTYDAAKKSLCIYIFGCSAFIVMCGFMGLVAYAMYHDCDPLTTGLAKAKDQVIPLLVMKTTRNLPGLPGLFVAGVFSAALSSLSTGLNSMSAVAHEDFIKPNCKTPPSERATTIILRSIVVIYGVILVALVFLVEKLGQVLVLSIGLASVAFGASLGVFLCGMLMPWINSKGALFGGIAGMLVNLVIMLGQQSAKVTGKMSEPDKPTSVAGCDYTFDNPSLLNIVNSTVSAAVESTPTDQPLAIFRISYFMLTMVGALTTITFANVISYATGNLDIHEKDSKLFSPFVRRWLERKKKEIPEEKKLMEMTNLKPILKINNNK